MGFLSLPDPVRDEDTSPEESCSVVVEIVGSTACGCTHCRAFDLGAGNLIRETHVGVGASATEAVQDAVRQCYEKHPYSELSAESWRDLAVSA